MFGTDGEIGWTEVALCDHPGVVIGRKGAYRGVHYSRVPFFVIDTAFFLEPRVPMDLRWAYYALRAADVNSLDSGSAIPSTSREAFYRMQVVVPSVGEQRAIAGVLGALDDKIEVNRRMGETLEGMARAVFQSWFVDFDPVRAKDEGWREGTLADVARLNPESWKTRIRPGEVRYLDLSNVKWGVSEEPAKLSGAAVPSRAQRILRRGDTIVGTVRPGNGSYAQINEDGITGSTGFAVLRAREARDAAFVYLAATRRESIEELAHVADGGAYPAVRPEVVASLMVPLAPLGVMREFSAVVTPLLARRSVAEKESRALAAVRDALLPKLISGEIRVRDAEKMAEAAVV